MKKVMFTAIAMIAFSSVSMGNTIADESVESTENKNEITIENQKKVVMIVKKSDCCAIYDLAYKLVMSETGDAVWADQCANYAYENCKK